MPMYLTIPIPISDAETDIDSNIDANAHTDI